MSIPVLELDSEIIEAIRARKEFTSSVLSAKQVELAYVMSHKGEDIAFICTHGDMYFTLDPSARHLMRMFGENPEVSPKAIEDIFLKSGELIHKAWEEGSERIAFCTVGKFAIACAVHGIEPDEYIVENLRDRGQLFPFLKMALKLSSEMLGESD